MPNLAENMEKTNRAFYERFKGLDLETVDWQELFEHFQESVEQSGQSDMYRYVKNPDQLRSFFASLVEEYEGVKVEPKMNKQEKKNYDARQASLKDAREIGDAQWQAGEMMDKGYSEQHIRQALKDSKYIDIDSFMDNVKGIRDSAHKTLTRAQGHDGTGNVPAEGEGGE